MGILIVIVVCTTVFMLQAVEAHAQREPVTVGLFENNPMCFTDESGRPAGIFIEVVEYVAEQEGWALQYEKGSWSDLLARLERGEIDVLPSMAVSEERLNLYTFNAIDVFNNWAEVYVGRTSGITSLLDLKEKRIATLRDGIYTSGPEGIRVLNDRFHLNAKIVEVDEYRQVMAAVRDGTADAAVVNRLVGPEFASEYNLRKSGIVFAPVAIRFAFNRESLETPVLIEDLDRHMETLLVDNDSVYHRAIIRALGETGYIETIPEWVEHVLIGGSAALLVFVTMVFLLGKQVKVRTDSLQQSEEMFRNTFEQAAVGLAHVSIDGAWLRVNRKLCDIVGYSPEQLLQRTFQDITQSDDLDADLGFAKQVLAGVIDTYSMEKRYLRMDGSIVWINLTVSLVRDRNEKPLYFISVVEDISERKHLYEDLRLSEEKFSLLFQHSPDSITLTSIEDGTLVEVNSTFLNYTGYAEEEVIGKTSADLSVWANSDHRKQYMDLMWSQGRVVSMEVDFRAKSGELLKGLISGDVVEIHGKKYILSVTRDVSDRKRVEAELKRLTSRLEEMVAERTVELENTQEALVYLLEDVNEAKKKLEDKIAEIERLNRVFVKRELRMVELKQQMQKLGRRIP